MPTRPIPSRWLVRLPRQARSVDTMHAILDAAARLFEREGAEALTTHRVARAAGTNPSTLYEYFANVDTMLAAVVERQVLEVESTVRAALEQRHEEPPAQALRAAAGDLVATLEPQAALVRAFLSGDTTMAREGMTSRLQERLLVVLETCFARQLTDPSALPLLYVAVHSGTFALLKWLAARPEGPAPQEMAQLLASMLGGPLHAEA